MMALSAEWVIGKNLSHFESLEGKSGIRAKTGYKKTTEDVDIGKTNARILIGIRFHSPHASKLPSGPRDD
jgi:hypothetical protein